MTTNAKPNLELLTLIWLDGMVDATQENREIQEKFRSVINYLRTFDNCRECEHYIRNTINDKQEKIILIVSGRLCEEITERIHDLKQVISIFIFCFDKEKYDLWAKKYKKVRGVIVLLHDLLRELDVDRKSEEQKLNELIEMFTTEDNIIPVLLQIKSTLIDKKDLLNICFEEYKNNITELEKITDFEHLYSSTNGLKDFFDETFLYRLLIKSLHMFDIQMLYLLRFFLQDIDTQLKTCSAITAEKVYRAQLMTTDQIHFLSQSIQENTVRFNTFIIASKNQEQILKSLQNSSNANNLQRALFEIDENDIGKEYKQYVIFPITTYFRVISVRMENRIWYIRMTVEKSSEKSFIEKPKNAIELAQYLKESGQLDQSEKLFEILAHQPSLSAQCYDELGRIAQDKGLYKISLDYYLRSYQTVSQQNLAYSLNNIGCAYDYLEQYHKAFQFYSQALTLMKNDQEQSMCISNLGVTYAKNNESDRALECFERALSIRMNYFPENHPAIGISYTNLGAIWSSLDRLDDALESYNLALNCFPLNSCFDLNRAIVYQNMADIFQEKNQLDQALKFYQNAEQIFRQIQSTDHPNLLYIEQQINQIKQGK